MVLFSSLCLSLEGLVVKLIRYHVYIYMYMYIYIYTFIDQFIGEKEVIFKQ